MQRILLFSLFFRYCHSEPTPSRVPSRTRLFGYSRGAKEENEVSRMRGILYLFSLRWRFFISLRSIQNDNVFEYRRKNSLNESYFFTRITYVAHAHHNITFYLRNTLKSEWVFENIAKPFPIVLCMIHSTWHETLFRKNFFNKSFFFDL